MRSDLPSAKAVRPETMLQRRRRLLIPVIVCVGIACAVALVLAFPVFAQDWNSLIYSDGHDIRRGLVDWQYNRKLWLLSLQRHWIVDEERGVVASWWGSDVQTYRHKVDEWQRSTEIRFTLYDGSSFHYTVENGNWVLAVVHSATQQRGR